MRDALRGGPQVYEPGMVLSGRYRLGNRIGRGATADVYRAVDERLGRDVAIKLFGLTEDDIERERIAHEMRTLAGLRHPNLVTVFDAGYVADSDRDADERPFLVLELVEGETVRQRLGRGPLAESETRAIGLAVADALAYVHAMGLVHRDIKPANILLDTTSSGAQLGVKLADFGIARLSGSPHLTAEGTAVGTASYLSPEQVTGDEVSGASDVYSLGLVLIECLTGHTAFAGEGVETALTRLHRDPDIPRWLAPRWRWLLRSMTTRSADERPLASDVAAKLGGGRSQITKVVAGEGVGGDDGKTTAMIAVGSMGALGAVAGDVHVGDTARLPSVPSVPLVADAPPRRRRRALLGIAIAGVAAALLTLIIAAAASDSGTFRPPPAKSSPPAHIVPVTTHSAASTSHLRKPPPPPPPKHHEHGHGGDGGGD